VVVGLAFLEIVEVGLERFLAPPRGAIDAGELLIGRIATPIGAGDREQFEVLDVAGGGDVRPAAEIGEIALLINRDQFVLMLFDELLLIRIGAKIFSASAAETSLRTKGMFSFESFFISSSILAKSASVMT
jgi:hypothetical protein